MHIPKGNEYAIQWHMFQSSRVICFPINTCYLDSDPQMASWLYLSKKYFKTPAEAVLGAFIENEMDWSEFLSSLKHAYIMLTPLNPTFI